LCPLMERFRMHHVHNRGSHSQPSRVTALPQRGQGAPPGAAPRQITAPPTGTSRSGNEPLPTLV
jgi:hypothetical protein